MNTDIRRLLKRCTAVVSALILISALNAQENTLTLDLDLGEESAATETAQAAKPAETPAVPAVQSPAKAGEAAALPAKTDAKADAQPPKAAPVKAVPAAPVPESIETIPNTRVTIAKSETLELVPSKKGPSFTAQAIESICWSPDGKHILLDYQGSNQFYNLAVAKVKGSKATARILLNDRNNQNIRLHNYHPSFYKDNRHFIYVSQNPNSNEFKKSLPAQGLFSNLWLSDLTSSHTWQLTTQASSYTQQNGFNTPDFSPNGKKLAWVGISSTGTASLKGRYSWGKRSIMLADFSFENGTPSLGQVTDITPDRSLERFYETYGFTPDSKKILFASNLDGQDWPGMDVAVLNVSDRAVTNLTQSPTTWDRYAAVSPKSKKIVWSSSTGYAIPLITAQWQNNILSELWIMNANGKDKCRLTGYNDPKHPLYAQGMRSFIGPIAWHPTNPNKLAYVLYQQTKNYTISSSIVLIELTNALTQNLPKDYK